MPVVALANLVVAALLAGLIWTIGVVHYPLFDGVDPQDWVAYETRHQDRISLIAGPLILASAALALALLATSAPRRLAVANAAISLGALVATGLVFAPLHGELATGWDAGTHSLLVGLNWGRIVAWTAQVAIAWFVVRALLAPRAPD